MHITQNVYVFSEKIFYNHVSIDIKYNYVFQAYFMRNISRKINALIDIAEYNDDANLKNVASMGRSSLNW